MKTKKVPSLSLGECTLTNNEQAPRSAFYPILIKGRKDVRTKSTSPPCLYQSCKSAGLYGAHFEKRFGPY